MNTAELMQLCSLGWETFLKEGPTAALAFSRDQGFSKPRRHAKTMNLGAITANMTAAAPDGRQPIRASADLRVHAIEKRPGTPHANMITVGRTANNDVVLEDASVSRFHIYFQTANREWQVADAGSRNGTTLDGEPLAAKQLTPIRPGAVLKMGELRATFLDAPGLFSWLSERAARGQ